MNNNNNNYNSYNNNNKIAKTTNSSSTVTKRYSDNVFCLLYSDKKNLLDLYNALNNSSHTDVEGLTVTTLKGGTYMKYKNDASFVFSYELYMFEQQTTINYNMPLRFFHYGSEVYRDMFPNNMLHRRNMLKIPTPHFITFYNGREKMKERVKTLKLSDMFEQQTDTPELELVVTVINLNPDVDSDCSDMDISNTNNKGNTDINRSANGLFTYDILNRCQSLRDYMTFVNKVRNKTDVLNLDIRTSVTEAVDECIKEGVLSEFFTQHRNEVIDVSVFEYDEEGHMDVVREEGREIGFAQGEENAILKAIKNIVESLHLSCDEAMDILKIDIDKREHLKHLL